MMDWYKEVGSVFEYIRLGGMKQRQIVKITALHLSEFYNDHPVLLLYPDYFHIGRRYTISLPGVQPRFADRWIKYVTLSKTCASWLPKNLFISPRGEDQSKTSPHIKRHPGVSDFTIISRRNTEFSDPTSVSGGFDVDKIFHLLEVQICWWNETASQKTTNCSMIMIMDSW
jgi:hypothetical protein